MTLVNEAFTGFTVKEIPKELNDFLSEKYSEVVKGRDKQGLRFYYGEVTEGEYIYAKLVVAPLSTNRFEFSVQAKTPERVLELFKHQINEAKLESLTTIALKKVNELDKIVPTPKIIIKRGVSRD